MGRDAVDCVGRARRRASIRSRDRRVAAIRRDSVSRVRGGSALARCRWGFLMTAKKVLAAGLLLVVGVTALLEAQGRRGMRGGYYGVKRPEHITWNSDF